VNPDRHDGIRSMVFRILGGYSAFSADAEFTCRFTTSANNFVPLMVRLNSGGTSLVSHRHRVVACRRGRSRSGPPDGDVSRWARFAPPARPTLAVGGHLPPWRVVDRGRALQSSAVTPRPRVSRIPARSTVPITGKFTGPKTLSGLQPLAG
jgi:hypothetical protein